MQGVEISDRTRTFLAMEKSGKFKGESRKRREARRKRKLARAARRNNR